MQYNKCGTIAVYSKNEEGTCDELVVDLYNRSFEYTGNLEEQELSGKTVGGIKTFEVPQEFFRQFFDVVDAQFDGSYYTVEKTYSQRLAESRRRAAEEKKKPVVGHETLKKRYDASFLNKNWATSCPTITVTKRAITAIFPFFTKRYMR